MELVFDTHGNDKQKLVCTYWIDQYVTDILYGGSKGSGKSFLGCSLIFGDALIYPGTFYFIARKKLNDLRKFTIPSIYEVLDKWGLSNRYYKWNGQDSYFELYNGSRVYLLDAKYLPSDPDYYRFGSMQMTRGWIEEAGEFEVNAKNNLAASIGRWKNDVYNLTPKLLQTCNPSKNYLYKDYYKKSIDDELEDWKKFVQALPQDNKMLPAGYIENLMRFLSPAQKERLIYGKWEYEDGPEIMMTYNKIMDLFSNEFVPEGDMYMTADIARLGKDWTRIGIWSGWRLIKVISKQVTKVNESVDLVNQARKDYKVPLSNVIADEDGIGGGVVDYTGCLGFVAQRTPFPDPRKNENYGSLKDQCGFYLAGKVNANDVFLDIQEDKEQEMITEELEQIKQKSVDDDQKKRIVPKPMVKNLIGRSPDYSDMILMRSYFDLMPSHKVKLFA